MCPRERRSIMVGVDGRDAAWRALHRALDLYGHGVHLTVIAVTSEEGTDASARQTNLLAQVERWLLQAQATASLQGAHGDPAAELDRHARASGADLIVVGHNNGATARPPGLGSVSERLLQNPPCDVLVIR